MNIVMLGGAAHMAQPALKYLFKQDEIKQIILADLNLQLVEKIANEFGEKVIAKAVDVNNEEQLKATIDGTDLVINFVGPYFKFGTKIVETVIDAGINYIDICDDHDTTLEALELDKKAKERGVTALIGMGASPGITNVLSRLAADELDEVEEINTYWLVGKSELGGFGAMIHMFHIIDGKVPVFRDGQLQYTQAFQEELAKRVNFGEPVGEVTLYPVGHPEPVTLSKYIEGVQIVTNYGGLLPAHLNNLYRTLVDFGITNDEFIPINHDKVSTLDFLKAYFQYKQEKTPDYFSVGEKPVGASRIEVIGKKDGESAKVTFTKAGHYTMANSTSLPTGVAAYLMLKGEITTKGVIPPECIDPKKLLLLLKNTDFFGETNMFHLEQKIGKNITTAQLFDTALFSN